VSEIIKQVEREEREEAKANSKVFKVTILKLIGKFAILHHIDINLTEKNATLASNAISFTFHSVFHSNNAIHFYGKQLKC
jgi:hypothetical protein